MPSSALSLQFLGNTEVEGPKGTEVVKDAVRKLKVNPVLRVSRSPKDREMFLSDRIGLDTRSTGEVGVNDKCSPPSSVTKARCPWSFFELPSVDAYNCWISTAVCSVDPSPGR